MIWQNNGIAMSILVVCFPYELLANPLSSYLCCILRD